YDGKQSVPLFYNNTTASLSEVTANVADLQAGRDWAKHGIKGLTLRFRGDPANVLQQLYVKINGAKVAYDGSAENLRRAAWQMWYIDLASLGVSLSNVTKLTIGLERIGTVGGQGMVLLDGIRLYAYDRQSITPADPGTTSLQAQYPFEGNTNDSSGNGRNGTAMGGPLFAAGQVGQAISLDGIDDYVEITGYKGILGGGAFSIAAWVRSTSTGDATMVCWGASTLGQRVDFRLFEGRLRVEHGNGNLQANTVLADDQWHHVALTVTENASISYPAVKLYLDGNDDSQTTTDPDPFDIVASIDVNIGRRGTNNDRSFQGLIDDVRIYDRVLSPEEIAWVAGLTKPFDKAF
ncbi:MAG TPA: LamG domain-containing protein, partial [Sedimentisphaerales bacterium]|nr:LamG domain-containing protein [Sedimentisphaerales bacterium]